MHLGKHGHRRECGGLSERSCLEISAARLAAFPDVAACQLGSFLRVNAIQSGGSRSHSYFLSGFIGDSIWRIVGRHRLKRLSCSRSIYVELGPILVDSPPQPKATRTTIKVLEAFLERPLEERHGFDLLAPTETKSGTLYPILVRFEKLGWLGSRWEDTDRPGPRRRLYRLTAEGEPAARQFVASAKVRTRLGPTERLKAPAPAGGAAC
ncbi:MAG TPA: helix-turn-helix transcriptional regulator [Solirubrobacterales bacterium]|nr:helix-turn-helix transcriptional regulator [Solirubrobacterales bacterium]